MRGERTLLLLEPRYVRVAEHRDAVGREREHLLDRGLKRFGGLMRQAVDEVDVEALKAQLARGGDQVARHFVWLHAVDRLLHLRLEILDAHAEAVEAHAPQRFEMRAAGDTRVDLDPDFGVRVEGKPLARVTEEIFELRG